MNLSNILNRFKEKNILVIGDLMLDKYIYGNVSRISPEAPVQVVKVEKEKYCLGGAGNVAGNMVSLSANASLISLIGNDLYKDVIKELLNEKKIKFRLIEDKNKPTILKKRILVGNQQLIRVDYENPNKITKDQEEKIKKYAKELIRNVDLIVVSDYNKGLITKNIIDFLKGLNKKILVDPKPQNIDLYKNLFLIKSNLKEAEDITNIKADSEESLNRIGFEMNKNLSSNILITRKEGMDLFKENKRYHFPSQTKEIYDICGAGDTSIAALALAIASNASLDEAIILAVHAAGIVITKAGVATVNINELRNSLLKEESKLKGVDELREIVEDLKRKNRKIVWSNGCFDILHVGHVRYLQKAKKLGDVLIIGLNNDESVKKLKGNNRPIIQENERGEILSSLECVDYILIFSETSVEKYLSLLKPDIFVKGGDYNLKTINQKERKIVESYNGTIKFIPIIKDKSTTGIIEKIKNS